MDTERLYSDIRSHLRDDPFSTEHNQSDPKWSLDPDGPLRHQGQIYVPDSNNLQLHVLQYSHDHPLAGHYGQAKTLYQVHLNYYWPRLPVFVKNYCKSCTTCSHAKPVHHRPYGLLKQLPIPEKPWNSISMDFIEKIPPSSSYTSILVIVDRLTSSCFSFRLTTRSHLNNSHNYSFSTSFPSMVSPAMSLLTVAQNSFPTFSGPLELHWT